tara:strand:- start:329 stop:865 length:537 start_codon:yes stop_codon:yes gene_type:complete
MIRKFLFLIFIVPLIAKDIFYTRSGKVSFFSSTPIEDIKALNEQTTCVLDMETGNVSFRIPILGFNFKNGLMQEHFNENYLESDIYPDAGFKGKINNWAQVTLTEEPQLVSIEGAMTIHGVSKQVEETGKISFKNDKVNGTATFKIIVADYDIQIPKIVRENIAKVVDVNVKLSLKKK